MRGAARAPHARPGATGVAGRVSRRAPARCRPAARRAPAASGGGAGPAPGPPQSATAGTAAERDRLAAWGLLSTPRDASTGPLTAVRRLSRGRWHVARVGQRRPQLLRLKQLRSTPPTSGEAPVRAFRRAWAWQAGALATIRAHLPTGTLTAPTPVSSWLLAGLGLATLRQQVPGTWSHARLQACLPRLQRFVVLSPRQREHQESTIRRLRPVVWLLVYQLSVLLLVCLFTCLPACPPACLRAWLVLIIWLADCSSSCLAGCLVSCLVGCLSACPPACLSACLPAWLSACPPACLSACLPACLVVWLLAWLVVCSPACLAARLLVWLLACLSGCSPACLAAVWLAIWLAGWWLPGWLSVYLS